MIALLLFASFFLLLGTGMPIFAALGLSGMVTIAAAGLSVDSVPVTIYGAVTKYNLLAVPMFVLTGVLLDRSGIAKRLLALSAAIVGHGPGALAVTAVILAILMGGISGSASAIAATVGGIMTSEMVRAGYPRPFIAAVVGTAASTDILVPPGVALIVYAIMVPQVSVPEMFAAGLVPGTLCGLALIAPVYFISRLYGFGSDAGTRRPPFWRSLKEASLGLFAKVVILGGLRVGAFTPTEAGVVAACYSAFLGIVVYRTLKPRTLFDALVEAGELTGVILIILGFASVFGWALSTIGLIDPVVAWITGLPIGQYGVLTLIIILLTTAGIFLEGLPIFVIFLPLLVPIADKYHWNMVWFGIVMTFMIVVGMCVPLLSINLMIGARIAQTPIEATTRWMRWLILPMIGMLALCVAVPEVVLWFPRVSGFMK